MGQKPAIDPEAFTTLLELQSEDDPDLVKSLIQLFLDTTPARLASLKKAFAERNAKVLYLEAHGLKSGCANMGALDLARICGELEKIGKSSGSLDAANLLIHQFEAEYERAQSELLFNVMPKAA